MLVSLNDHRRMGSTVNERRSVVTAFFVSLAALALLAAPASGASKPKISRIVPAEAVVGSAIEVKGSGLSARGLRATVGGKKATVFPESARRMHVVVPKLPKGAHDLVIRRGRRSSSATVTVLRPFDGEIDVKADESRASASLIGPGGGEVVANGRDGTRYTLSVPAGALAQDETITVTPVVEFRGLPLTGGDPFGAVLAPDGLRFATPATLRIEAKRAFPPATVGFSSPDGGDGFEVHPATGSGRVVTFEIEHFSSAGAGGATAADFANAIQPLIANLGNLTEGQIETVADLIGTWDALFPPAFCASQPVCGQALQKAFDSAATLIDERCVSGRANPQLSAVRDLVRLAALHQRVALASGQNASEDPGKVCRDEILGAIFTRARAASGCGAGGDPLGRHNLAADVPTNDGGGGDIDGDGELTNLEFLFFLIGPLQAEGLEIGEEAQSCALNALDALPGAGRTLCASDRPAAERNLVRALDYAQALQQVLQPFIDALDFCRIEIEVTPADVTVTVGAQQPFAATTANTTLDPNNEGVTWSATGGTITPGGVYTAPVIPGTYVVTATSVLNPQRKDTATVLVRGPYDLRVSLTDETDPAPGTAFYQYTVTNDGPHTARSVQVTFQFSAPAGAGCTGSQVFQLGDIAVGQTVASSTSASCSAVGQHNVTVSMTAQGTPPDAEVAPANNSDQETTRIDVHENPCPVFDPDDPDCFL